VIGLGELPLLELAVDHEPEFPSLRLGVGLGQRFELVDQDDPQALEKLPLDPREGRLDHLVKELIADVVERDADVGESRADRSEVELLDRRVRDRGDRGDLPLGALARDPEAGELDRSRLGRDPPQRGTEGQERGEALLARTGGRDRRPLFVRGGCFECFAGHEFLPSLPSCSR